MALSLSIRASTPLATRPTLGSMSHQLAPQVLECVGCSRLARLFPWRCELLEWAILGLHIVSALTVLTDLPLLLLWAMFLGSLLALKDSPRICLFCPPSELRRCLGSRLFLLLSE